MPNLLDVHPPFQIDGNFGGAAGVLEMLVRSEEGVEEAKGDAVIWLLPACPAAWQKGRVSGVRARGGFEVAFDWEGGRIGDVVVTSLFGGACEVVFGDCGGSVSVKGEGVHRLVHP